MAPSADNPYDSTHLEHLVEGLEFLWLISSMAIGSEARDVAQKLANQYTHGDLNLLRKIAQEIWTQNGET